MSIAAGFSSLPTRAILRIADVCARYVERPWALAFDHAEAIQQEWRERIATTPALFDGQVLRQVAGRVEGDLFYADYALCNYSAFLYWLSRDGLPDPGARNGFALAALRSADGAYLPAIAGPRTANAGRVYFPGGTPDMSDVTADGQVDLAASAVRELQEETGLKPEEFRVSEGFTLVIDGPRVAFLRRVDLPISAEDAHALIAQRLAAQDEPELAGMRIVRSPADIDRANMPRFMVDFLEYAFANRL